MSVTVTQVGVIGGWVGGVLIPLPFWVAKGYDSSFVQSPATSLRLPLTHSALSFETIMNK